MRPQSGQRPGPSVRRSANTTVVSPATAASVIATPSSTVRTIVSATIWAGADVGSTAGLPGVDDAWRENLHRHPPGARPIAATRPHRRGSSYLPLHSQMGRAEKPLSSDSGPYFLH